MITPPLWLLFIFSLIPFFLGRVLLPTVHFFPFAPFLALVFLKKEFLSTLWIGLFVGLLLDLFSTSTPFGMTTLCVILSCLIAYPFRKTFFEHHLLFLPLSSALISFAFTLFQWILVGKQLPLLTALTTLFIAPLIDAIFAFFWFTCPLFLYNRWRIWN